MRLLFDENIDRSFAEHFRSIGHDVIHIGSDNAAITDEVVLNLARREQRLLITYDLDFGRLIFYRLQAKTGIVLLRLSGVSTKTKIAVFDQLLTHHGKQLRTAFTVVDDSGIRLRHYK